MTHPADRFAPWSDDDLSPPPVVAPGGLGRWFRCRGFTAVTELDWWEERRLGDLTFVATPARHFSGRGVLDLEHTLWAGFAILGPQHRVFYSGDTAMFPGLLDHRRVERPQRALEGLRHGGNGD